jgi:hypothetical protein
MVMVGEFINQAQVAIQLTLVRKKRHLISQKILQETRVSILGFKDGTEQSHQRGIPIRDLETIFRQKGRNIIGGGQHYE